MQLLAVFRFKVLILAYAVCRLRHWWAIAVSIPGWMNGSRLPGLVGPAYNRVEWGEEAVFFSLGWVLLAFPESPSSTPESSSGLALQCFISIVMNNWLCLYEFRAKWGIQRTNRIIVQAPTHSLPHFAMSEISTSVLFENFLLVETAWRFFMTYSLLMLIITILPVLFPPSSLKRKSSPLVAFRLLKDSGLFTHLCFLSFSIELWHMLFTLNKY